MDPTVDRQVSEHVLRMHRFRSATNGGSSGLDGTSSYERDEEAETVSTVYVKYNRMLHGRKSDKSRKRDTLAINFLKKYIHYAKHRIQPELTDEVSDQIATAYAELRNASSNAKSAGGTLPITARTLETIIRLSTAHAKLKLRKQVLKSDVEAALQVLNFAIYHQELTEMEEREQERATELERKRKADNDVGNDGRGRNEGDDNGSSASKRGKRQAMEVDDPPAAEVDLSSERLEAFSTALGRHRHALHLEQMPIADIEAAVNVGASVPYSKEEIMSLLEIMHGRGQLMIVEESNVVYFI